MQAIDCEAQDRDLHRSVTFTLGTGRTLSASPVEGIEVALFAVDSDAVRYSSRCTANEDPPSFPPVVQGILSDVESNPALLAICLVDCYRPFVLAIISGPADL